MKISRLYVKLFLAFVAVLICADIVVFTMILRGELPPPMKRHIMEKITLTNDLIEREAGKKHLVAGGRDLQNLITDLARGFHWRIWITDGAGEVIAKSFKDPVPLLDQGVELVDRDPERGIVVYAVTMDGVESVYLVSELALNGGENCNVNVLTDRRRRKELEWFLKWMLVLTVVGALFYIPVSRKITRPLHRLSEAADRLGKGDFSQRVPEGGNDEVAVLASKFNTMANRLEQMVLGGKELTANLSHELRSPLARLRISLQMLVERTEKDLGEEKTGDMTAGLLDKMACEIENMDTLIGHILDLSKRDMREPAPRTDKVDIAAQLRALLDNYGPMAEKRNLTIHTDIGPMREFPCNGHDMSILLDNVLGNAIKYTSEGGEVQVSARSKGEALEIVVRNTHPELSAEEMENIFTPFHRLGKTGESGTGLGLAVARKIAEAHGGSIRARHRDGWVCLEIVLPA